MENQIAGDIKKERVHKVLEISDKYEEIFLNTAKKSWEFFAF